VAGNVDHLADKEEAGDFTALHGFGGKLGGVDTASGNLGFFEAFGSGGKDRPGVDLFFKIGEGLVRPRGWGLEIKPAVGETLGKNFSEFATERD
jgi:hypothetical protein